MNMYLHELRSLLKSTILWTCSIVALAAVFIASFSSMAGDAAELRALLGGYPEAVRAMLGINLEYVTSFLGFYSMIFSFIVLFGAIQAMNMGTSILSKETRERTADFLLVKPVTRTSIVTAKLLAAATMILLTNIMFYAVSVIIAGSAGLEYSAKLFLMINVMLPFIQLIFLSIGVCVSVFFTKLKSVLPVSLGTVFGFYFIGAVIATGKDVAAARYLSPFRYFDIFYIIEHTGYEVPYLIAGLAIIAAAIAISYVIYNRKDIHAVS